MNAAPWTPARHKYSVDDYYRLGELGILPPDARTELIYGEIFDMSPPGSRHASVVDQLIQSLIRGVGDGALVRAQNPLRLDEFSEPQPDLALLRPRDDRYRHAHPTAADVLLVVEVGDSSAAYDRRVKAALYASAGVPELWLIDLTAQRALILRVPNGDSYRTTLPISADEALQCAAFPDLRIELATLL